MNTSVQSTIYTVVQHTCGHFELRRMRASAVALFEATNQCSACAHDGRPAHEHFDDAQTALSIARERSAALIVTRA